MALNLTPGNQPRGNTPGSQNGPPLTPGAVLAEIPKFLIDKAMGALSAIRPAQQPVQPPMALPNPNNPSPAAQSEARSLAGNMPRFRREPWFGPSQPIPGQAPRGDVAGRARDYPVGINLSTVPRQYEPVSFWMMRGLFEGLDMAKLAVETRKNQMAKLNWEIMPRMKAGQNVRVQDDPRCAQLEAFFRSPDRIHNWDQWMRMLLHEMMVIDAPAIYVRRTLGGDVYSLEIVDGADIIPLIDKLGRRPASPEPAYSHILKGIPAINYTADEMIYFPRNLRAGKVYGQSAIELILLTIQIAIRRDVNKLQFWTEGNIPDALIGVPENWTPDQIASMQRNFDLWTSDQAQRRKAYFIPGGTNFVPTRPAQTLDPQQDEWLARLVTYAFNLPNLPLVNQQNRAVAETANDAGLREGLAPVIVWLKGLMDKIIGEVFGFPDLEWVMDNAREEAPAELSSRQISELRMGALSLDEYRAERGLEQIGMKHAIWGIGPLGIMFVDDLVKAHQQGLLMPPPPPSPDAGAAGGSPFDPPGQGAISGPPPQLALPAPQSNSAAALATPAARQSAMANAAPLINHHLADLPPHMLDAVGIKPDYEAVAHPAGKPSKKKGGKMSAVVSLLEHHEARFTKGAAANDQSAH